MFAQIADGLIEKVEQKKKKVRKGQFLNENFNFACFFL